MREPVTVLLDEREIYEALVQYAARKVAWPEGEVNATTKHFGELPVDVSVTIRHKEPTP